MFEFHITGAQLSRATGISEKQISKFRSGKSEVNASNLQKIVMALPPKAMRFYMFLAFDMPLDLPETPDASPLVRFIRAWQMREKVSDLELQTAIQQRTYISNEEFNQIMQGRPATDNELFFIGSILTDPEGKLYQFEYLQAVRDGETPGDQPQGHKENGNCGTASH